MCKNIIVADIGGTNARFAHIQNSQLADIKAYDTREIDDISLLVSQYIAENDLKVDHCILSVAGQVNQNHARLTNADLYINSCHLAQILGMKSVHLLNDFEAIAWASLSPEKSDPLTIRKSEEKTSGNKLIIGPGTGLGIAALLASENSRPIIHRCEGGHIALRPNNDFEKSVFRELALLWPETSYNSYDAIEAEALISGTGFPLLYKAVCRVLDTDCIHTSASSILSDAFSGNSELANITTQIFKEHLGMLTSNLALLFDARGGIYFAGGVVRKNPWLLDRNFVGMIHTSSRFSNFFPKPDIYLFKSDYVGLQGAANFAASMIKH